ncbi:MAG: hypothetical protein IKR25_12730 [Muribaculaceae bacterium]|nr:hypothetical protein [Muribaculaceae bacterium]
MSYQRQVPLGIWDNGSHSRHVVRIVYGQQPTSEMQKAIDVGFIVAGGSSIVTSLLVFHTFDTPSNKASDIEVT